MTNQLMIQQSILMKIFQIFLILIFLNKKISSLNSSCYPCSSHLCYQCLNTFPIDRINVDKLIINCNSTDSLFKEKERFYSTIQFFTTINCTMKTLYFDQFTLWNYLEYMSITYANLTRLSSMIFNQTSSLPVLYSIKTLNLSYNSIEIITKNFSYYFPSLEKLDLSYNHLKFIRKKTFFNLIYLKELYLNNNYLKQILPNIFPPQSLYFINLNMNYWHCSCTNVLTLSISQPIPICYTPIEFQYKNASDIARQCFLRTKANILIKINKEQNLTCVLSTIFQEWKNKINRNITIGSAWHIEQRRSISLEQLSALSNKSDKYLICYNFTSTHPESIYAIISPPFTSIRLPLSSKSPNSTKIILLNITRLASTTTIIVTSSSSKLPPFFLWLFKTSKNILPKYFQSSDRHVLIAWLILLTIAFSIFLFLIYFIHHHHKILDKHQLKKSRSFIRFDTNSHDHRTLFNVKLTCKNHKCLCQYRRRAHSTLYLTKPSTNEKQSYSIQPSFIQPSQLRYAKIKRISSTKKLDNDYSTGEFRTIVKLKSLPN